MKLSRRQAIAGAAAATILAISPRGARAQAFPKLRRGINLHHLLNWPEAKSIEGKLTYAWPPFQGRQFSIDNAELNALSAAGFDFVRLTVDPSIFIEASGEQRRELERHAKSVLQHLLQADLKVIFDLHPVAINPAYEPHRLVENETAPPFQAFANLVAWVADWLRAFPHERVALELMNEPLIFGTSAADVQRWQRMLEILHGKARSVAPNLPLILSGAQSSYRKALYKLDLSAFRGSNVLYTFHFYEPYAFTHQGVPRTEPQLIAGLAWPERDDNVAAVTGRLQADAAAAQLDEAGRAKALADASRLLADYQRQRYDAGKIASSFDEVAGWAADNGIAPDRILLGEFGCVDAAGGLRTGNDRLNWISAVVGNAERVGFPWAYWAYKGKGGMQLLDERSSELDVATLTALRLRRPG